MKKLVTILSLTCLLQGCIFVVGAAAGAAAIAMVYDHRPIEETIQDTKTANKLVDNIRAVPALRNESHIDVTVFNHVVLLTFCTPETWRAMSTAVSACCRVTFPIK